MAKKTRKVRKQASAARAIQQAVANTQSVTKVDAPVEQPAVRSNRPASRQSAPIDPVEEYKYVRQDLKRIAVLAVSFTSVLVILSFFIK
jgi:uncharacterized protein (DUF934 family)